MPPAETETASSIEIVPFEGGVGVELRGIDLSRPVSAADLALWKRAFEIHRVLLFRGQHFTVEQHIAFSRLFGALEDFPDPKDQAEGYPMVLRVSNIERDTGRIKPVDEPGHKSFTLGTSGWHIDSSYRRVPSKASFLFAVEIPADGGGDTMFADTARAWEDLPAAKKEEIDRLVVVHDFEEARRVYGLPPRPPEVQAATPPARQPLVPHLPGGRRALFLGTHAAFIDGMDRAAGRALLDELTAFATQPRYTYRHRWRLGDLVMFDNICVMHRAMPYDLTGSRRLLHRTTVAGQGPLASS